MTNKLVTMTVMLLGLSLMTQRAWAQDEELQHWLKYPVPHGTPMRTRPSDAEFLSVLPPLRTPPAFSDEARRLGFAIWWSDYSQHIFQEQPPTEEDLRRAPVARTAAGEYEPLVLGLWGIDYTGLVTVTVEKPPFPLTVRTLTFNPRPVPSEYDGGRTLDGSRVVGFANYLPENHTVTVEPGRNGVAWLTFSVPEDTKPGRYDVELQLVLHSKRKIHHLSAAVEVLPLTLPRANIAYGMYFSPYVSWLGTRYTSPGLIRKYWEDLKQHGMTSCTLYNYSRLHDDAGNLKLDGVREIEWLEEMIAVGLVTPDVPVMFLDGGGVRREHPKAQEIFAAFKEEIARRGWPEFLWYGPDEPAVNEQSLASLQTLQPLRQQFRVVTAISDHAATTYADLLDVWTVNAGRTSPELQKLAADKGAEVWNYTCSNRGMGNSPFERFYAGVYTWALRLKGNFIWAYAQNYTWEGDRNAVYCYGLPSDGGPIPSVAWEARREGVEDYRVLVLLESLIAKKPDSTEARAAKTWLDGVRNKVDWYLARNMPPSLYTLDGPELYPLCPNFEPAELAQARTQAIDYILQLR